MKLLVTGANGFIGSAICSNFALKGFDVLGSIRQQSNIRAIGGLKYYIVGNIDGSTDWEQLLTGVDCVIHCASTLPSKAINRHQKLELYSSVNVHGTRNLATYAARFGVKRFVFLSSIHVNGHYTQESQTFSQEDIPNPVDIYSQSKWEAEKLLYEISTVTGMDVLVLRLPLVYGPGVKGNFLRLIRLVDAGIPLPLGAVRNQRSMLSLNNLVDLLTHCVQYPRSLTKTLLASDNEDVSTPCLIRLIGEELNKPARLFSVPIPLLENVTRLMGMSHEFKKMVCSMRVDIEHTSRVLGWQPRFSMHGDIVEVLRWYQLKKGSFSI